MNIFKRLFKIGESEAHSAVSKLEDPIKMTEQGIRDLKRDLDKSLHSLAEVKALAIRAKNEEQKGREKANDYENKALMLLKKAQSESLDMQEAERLAKEALTKKELALKGIAQTVINRQKFDESVASIEANVKKIKQSISKYENELKTLKARVQVSEATQNLNKQMAQIDSGDTVSMIERMKEKVEQQEALAESYAEIANEGKSIDEEIDNALGSGGDGQKISDDLAALKAKLGIEKEE